MPTETADNKIASAALTSSALKVFWGNIAAAVLGLAASIYLGATVAYGFIIGYAIGAANIYCLFRIVKRGVSISPGRVGRLMAVNHFRFLLTAIIFIILISAGILTTPWPALTGLSLAIFTTVGVLIYSGRQEAD